MTLLCWLAGLWTSLRTLALVSGCDFVQIECRDPNLGILRCQRCGCVAVHWRRMPQGWEAA